jgi:Zn-finger nucleic acid-binding protein
MKCPRTGTPLKEVEIGGVKVDLSEGCGGVWFDSRELAKFDEAHETAGDELAVLMEQYRNADVDHTARIRSPRHPEVVMMRRFYSPARNIEIDECPKSGGIWLDPGELSRLRELFPSDADRRNAVLSFVSEVLSDSGMNRVPEAVDADTEPANSPSRLGALLRWIGGVVD